MPVPDLSDYQRHDPWNRFAMQVAVFTCYLLVAIALLYSAWRTSATSLLMDRLLDQQVSILQEIRNARTQIPTEVRSAVRNAAEDVKKDVLEGISKDGLPVPDTKGMKK